MSGTFLENGAAVKTPEFISETNFKMDEEGVVIAAASYTASNQECVGPMPFEIKGPFGLVMVDKETKTIMSMGQVLKMAEAPKIKSRYDDDMDYQ